MDPSQLETADRLDQSVLGQGGRGHLARGLRVWWERGLDGRVMEVGEDLPTEVKRLMGLDAGPRGHGRGRALRSSWASALTLPRPAGVYILIGAGALMMLVGFLGCCGAVQESQCMLGLVSVPCMPTALASQVRLPGSRRPWGGAGPRALTPSVSSPMW